MVTTFWINATTQNDNVKTSLQCAFLLYHVKVSFATLLKFSTYVLGVGSLFCHTARCELQWPQVQLHPIASDFYRPVQVTHAGDHSGRLFIVQQDGYIYTLLHGTTNLFLDISDRVKTRGNEQGLLSLAFHPRKRPLNHFYVNYTRKPDGATVISRFTMLTRAVDIKGDPQSEHSILIIPQFASNHNGGGIVFHPQTGYLYIEPETEGEAMTLRTTDKI